MPSIAYDETNPVGEHILPGGWASAPINDEKIKVIAQYATSTHAKAAGEELTLLTIQEARQQVVAGLNYKFALIVIRNKKQASATAVVWAKLDGTYELTEWSWK